MNKTGLFKVSRIISVGSMAEKTALLLRSSKRVYRGVFKDWWYLEFDFLAILEVSHGVKIKKHSCDGCMNFLGGLWSEEIARKYGSDRNFMWLFPRELRCNQKCIADSIFREVLKSLAPNCDCCAYSSNKVFKRNSPSVEFETGCERCTIRKSTGNLCIVYSTDITYRYVGCSWSFMWTSREMSIQTYDKDTLQSDNPVRQLIIPIDILPAVEVTVGKRFKHNCFLVPKKCNVGYCKQLGWRKSCCLAEIESFLNNKSSKHRKYYLLLKYVWKEIFIILKLSKPIM